jgi:hypothetical protein
MGTLTIEKDPTRPDVEGALRVVMGPATVWDKDNIDEGVEAFK